MSCRGVTLATALLLSLSTTIPAGAEDPPPVPAQAPAPSAPPASTPTPPAPAPPTPAPPTPAPPTPAPPTPAQAPPGQPLSGGEAVGILGKPVRSPTGEDMGRVVDVLVDQDGKPRAAVIDFGGFLGVGSRKIAVDWQLLQIRPGNRDAPVLLGLNRAQVQAAPEYKDADVAPKVIPAPLPPTTMAVPAKDALPTPQDMAQPPSDAPPKEDTSPKDTPPPPTDARPPTDAPLQDAGSPAKDAASPKDTPSPDTGK